MRQFFSGVLSSLSLLPVLYGLAGAQKVEKSAVIADADQIHFSIISRTAVTFDWIGSMDSIYYGTDANNLAESMQAMPAEFLPVKSPWVSDPGPYWEAKLTGLQENTDYAYKIGANGEINNFRTPPTPGTAGFRVCTASDMHSNSPECVAMFAQIAALKPAFVLTTGDLTGAGPDGQENVAIRFHDAMVWSKSAAWMAVEGNHDWEYTTADDLRTYKGRFDIPNPGRITSSPAVSAGSEGSEDWGWFDYGNTRFISCPEPWTSSSRNEWKLLATPVFAAAQNDATIKFIATFGHRSAYTSTYGRSPGETSLQKLLDGFHAAYPKYVLDLSGHNHQYERYHLSSGMNYIVNSTTGSYYHEGWTSPTKPAGCVFRAIHYGILVLDVTDTTIQGQFVCSVNTANPGNDYMPLEEPVCNNPGSVIDAFSVAASQSATLVRGDESKIPNGFSITNYPNPFNPTTIVRYALPHRSHVTLTVFNTLGQRVAKLVNGEIDAGYHEVQFNATSLASGVYFYRLQAGSYTATRKLCVMK